MQANASDLTNRGDPDRLSRIPEDSDPEDAENLLTELACIKMPFPRSSLAAPTADAAQHQPVDDRVQAIPGWHYWCSHADASGQDQPNEAE